MGLMGIGWILGVGLLAVVVWTMLKGMRHSDELTKMTDTPEETLKRRYARGEIDNETYQRMRRELKS
jgi:putative membrane protein